MGSKSELVGLQLLLYGPHVTQMSRLDLQELLCGPELQSTLGLDRCVAIRSDIYGNPD